MFLYIMENWRGRPLISREVVVNLISNVSTNVGLDINAELELNEYFVGIKVTHIHVKQLNIHPADFHGSDGNYTIEPVAT